MRRAGRQLQQLVRERNTELRNVGRLYVRTRREIRRSVSPDRFIRKHIGASLIVAAVVGMLIAPAPRYERAGHRSSAWARAWLGKLLAYVIRLVPGLREQVPELAEWTDGTSAAEVGAEVRGTSGEKNNADGWLRTLLTEVAAQIDWAAVMHALVEGIREAKGSRGESGDGEPAEASAEAVDAGGDFMI